jgi:hypothetical protein
MNDAGESQTEQPGGGYVRLPWPLVAAGLFTVLAVVLAAGLFANRYLRPQFGVVPTEVPLTAPLPTSTLLAVAVVTPTAVSTPTPLPERTPLITFPTTLTLPPVAAQTLAPTSTSVAQSSVSSTPSPLPTVEPALAEEVGKAYETFWRVRSQALLDLDVTHLAEVMDGPYLQLFEDRIGELRLQQRAIKTQVTLNYKVIQVKSEVANITDVINDDSFYVIPGTEEPITDPANDVLHLQLKLRKLVGAWKVIESVSAD